MDKTYFIQKAAMMIYANNSSMDRGGAWEKAKSLYEEGASKWFFPTKTDYTRKDRENDPERTDYRYPRNMHVRGEIDNEDVPF